MSLCIGNVAHDLKTPLQAFVSELDYIGDHISANKSTKLSSDNGCIRNVELDMHQSVQSMKNICNFMTMTINRYVCSNIIEIC